MKAGGGQSRVTLTRSVAIAPTARMTAEQERHLAVRSMAAHLSHGHVIERHTHPWHQFVCALSEAMTVFAGQWSWIVPPGKAVLIPADTMHSIRMWGDVAARFL